MDSDTIRMNSVILIAVTNILLFVHCYQCSLTSDDKNNLVDAHNTYRRAVAFGQVPNQPPAADMLQMIWSDDSAAIAQVWADKCSFSHQPKKDRRYGNFLWVNQNIALYSWINSTDGVRLWFNEVSAYNYSANACSGSTCGHYKQVVWATSKELGCGSASCNYDKQSVLYVICNYGPGGNNGRFPYKTGEACSMCPSGTSCINGLCN